MSLITLDSIPFAPEPEALLRTLRLAPGGEDAASLRRMIADAEAVARPKAACRVSALEYAPGDVVLIDGVALTSRVLRVNLAATHRAFVFVATAGVELDRWAAAVEGLLERFWADAILELALEAALGALQADLRARYQPGPLSMMNPGSLEDWPIDEQRALFAILGAHAEDIGVCLSDSLLMHPVKSVSGLLYTSVDTFESCQLCPIEDCPNRRAPYDAALYERKYGAR